MNEIKKNEAQLEGRVGGLTPTSFYVSSRNVAWTPWECGAWECWVAFPQTRCHPSWLCPAQERLVCTTPRRTKYHSTVTSLLVVVALCKLAIFSLHVVRCICQVVSGILTAYKLCLGPLFTFAWNEIKNKKSSGLMASDCLNDKTW